MRRRRRALAEWEAEQRRRAAAAAENARQWDLDHPIREDLVPVVMRLQDAQARLSKMRELQVLHDEEPPPLLVAAAEATVAAGLARLAEAARSAGTLGIRVPLYPGARWYLAVDGALEAA